MMVWSLSVCCLGDFLLWAFVKGLLVRDDDDICFLFLFFLDLFLANPRASLSPPDLEVLFLAHEKNSFWHPVPEDLYVFSVFY